MDFRAVMARQGEAVMAALKRLTAAQKAMRLLPGKGVLLTRLPNGVSVNVRAMVLGFTGSWHVALGGQFASVGLGFVDGIEPWIEGRPMSGVDAKNVRAKDGPPRLRLDETLFEARRSWIALRAEFDEETGKILQPPGGMPGLTIVQVKTLVSAQDTVHLHALAMLRRGPNETTGFGRVHQIAFFDYQTRKTRQNGRLRVFFDPA
jgi:hypothetical protein